MNVFHVTRGVFNMSPLAGRPLSREEARELYDVLDEINAARRKGQRDREKKEKLQKS